MPEPVRAARFVHWDGRVVPVEEARVSVLDTGFLYGDGVYDTMRAYGGRVFAQARHLARLERSAERVGMRVPSAQDLARRLDETLAANETAEAVLRITVTRGRLTRRLDLSSAAEPSVAITLDPIDPGADDARRAGIRAAYSRYVRTSRHPLAGVKSTSYQVSLLARNEARELGATEVLLANETGEICEGAAANVFFVEKNTLYTPSLSTGILGGITREVALECARERGIPVQEATFAPQRLERADEVFMTGTTIQIAAVVNVGSAAIAAARPGPIATALLEDYLAKVREETGSPAHGVRG